MKGVWESTTGKWSGDVDLNDGQLECLQQQFKQQLKWAEGIGLESRSTPDKIRHDLSSAMEHTTTELEFITSGKLLFSISSMGSLEMCFYCVGLQTAQAEYEEKLTSGHAAEQTMFALTWDIEELTQLAAANRTLHVDLAVALDIASNPDTDQHQLLNLPRKLDSIRKRRADMIRRTTRFKRKPATHIFVLMISSELRDKKPYALPVQCLPYAGLKESDIRRIVSELIKEMVAQGMKVAGKYKTSDNYYT